MPTLTFKKFRGQPGIESTECRLCKTGNESVSHLLSHCGNFGKTFRRRHNKALQYILFHVLVKYGLVDKILPWYSEVIIKPQYENDDINLLSRITEHTGPDGK